MNSGRVADGDDGDIGDDGDCSLQYRSARPGIALVSIPIPCPAPSYTPSYPVSLMSPSTNVRAVRTNLFSEMRPVTSVSAVNGEPLTGMALPAFAPAATAIAVPADGFIVTVPPEP